MYFRQKDLFAMYKLTPVLAMGDSIYGDIQLLHFLITLIIVFIGLTIYYSVKSFMIYQSHLAIFYFFSFCNLHIYLFCEHFNCDVIFFVSGILARETGRPLHIYAPDTK